MRKSTFNGASNWAFGNNVWKLPRRAVNDLFRRNLSDPSLIRAKALVSDITPYVAIAYSVIDSDPEIAA